MLLKSDYINYSGDTYKYCLINSKKYATDILSCNISTRFFTLSPVGLIAVKHHYCWDGASGPTYDTPSLMRASLFHDALYQAMREGLLDVKYRKKADRLYRRICLEDGMNCIRAWLHYRTLRLLGGKKRRGASEQARVSYSENMRNVSPLFLPLPRGATSL